MKWFTRKAFIATFIALMYQCSNHTFRGLSDFGYLLIILDACSVHFSEWNALPIYSSSKLKQGSIKLKQTLQL